MLTSANREDDAGAFSGGDDHVSGLGRTMHKVPLPQRPFLALDDQECLTGEDEEILLIDLPVVHPNRLAGVKNEQVDPDLLEVRRDLEVRPTREGQNLPPPRAVNPARLTRVQDEPSLPDWREPGLGLLERGFGNHCRIIEEGLRPGSVVWSRNVISTMNAFRGYRSIHIWLET
jgi:hypothetical protein